MRYCLTLLAALLVCGAAHTTWPLNVLTTERGEGATIQPGDYFGLSTEAGRYDFTVSGYPDGDRHGTFRVASGAQVAFTPHIFTQPYGGHVRLTGTATGPTGAKVRIWARPRGAVRSFYAGSVTPTAGHWSRVVSAKVTTRYEVSYEDAKASTLVYVRPLLRVATAAGTVSVTLRPVPALAHLPVRLLHLHALSWGDVASSQTSLRGVAVFRHLAPGRNYVELDGGGRYAGAQSAPFTVRG